MTTTIWLAAYVGLSPAVNLSPWVIVVFAGAVLLLAGVHAGRRTGRGIGGGFLLGAIIGAINFIIVASLNDRQTTSEALLEGAQWIAGFWLAAIVVCTIGAAIGAMRPTPRRTQAQWTERLALIVALVTLPLLISGGIVTGLEAGMAVPDWLTTFRYPMMFYPLVEMQKRSDVYAEHFHRLWGLLVGVSTIILVVHLHRVEAQRWLRRLSFAVLLAVIVQGVLGGTRVTENNIGLGIVHGIFAQIVFSTMVAMAAFASPTWRDAPPPAARSGAATDRAATIALPVLLIVQLALGALYRHLGHVHVLYTHIFMAAVVTGVAIFAAGRAWGNNRDLPVLPRLGKAVLFIVGLQIILGALAMIAVWSRSADDPIPPLEVLATTAHQATGAGLLALAALLMVWTRRLLAPADEGVAR